MIWIKKLIFSSFYLKNITYVLIEQDVYVYIPMFVSEVEGSRRDTLDILHIIRVSRIARFYFF